MDRKRLHDSSLFWATLGAAVGLIGGIFVAVGVARTEKGHELWGDGWFVFGIIVIAISVILLWWALTLFVAHHHAGKHMCPDPDAHRPVPGWVYQPVIPEQPPHGALPVTPEQTAEMQRLAPRGVVARGLPKRAAEPRTPQPGAVNADNAGDDVENKGDQAGHSGSAQA